MLEMQLTVVRQAALPLSVQKIARLKEWQRECVFRMVQQGVEGTKQKYLNSAVQRQEITKCGRNGWRVTKKGCGRFVFRALYVSNRLPEHKRVIYNYLRKK